MRNRDESGFRNTLAKDEGFSPHLGKKIALRITAYCKETNQNRTRFVEMCCSRQLDLLEREMLSSKTKEELIEMYLNK